MTDEDGFNLFLTAPRMTKDEIRKVKKGMKCNHFPGNNFLGRKDLLWKCLNEKLKAFPNAYNIVPKSWLIPQEYKEFTKEREDSTDPDALWISKPFDSA